jgi:DNA-binding PadR family transcriptional regulator
MNQFDTHGLKGQSRDKACEPFTSTSVCDDDGVHPTDLSQFQVTILAILAEEARYGLAVKRALEDFYGENVNHGRLYPNLDELDDWGLVARRDLDGRTNEYRVTAAGRRTLTEYTSWLVSHLDADLVEDDYRLVDAEPAVADGGDE